MALLRSEDDGRVERFLSLLYERVEGGCIEVRGIDSAEKLVPRSKSDWLALEKSNSFKEAKEYAKTLNTEGYDAFFMVNPVCRGCQEDKDVLSGVALFADIDDVGSEEEAEGKLKEALTFPLKPDAAVFSGKGLHLYSFLRDPVDPAGPDWSLYLRALRSYAKTFGGDLKCTNPSRVLRFPLSWSHKRGRQTKLWLQEDEDKRIP